MAPGMVAYTVFSTPFFESLYSAYVRMFYQKTWDGILATQVELRHIVWGEITWASARGVMNASVVAVVILVMHMLGLVHVKWQFLPLLPLIGFIAGWAFSAFGLIFTALVPNIDHMNYPVFLIGVPLGLVSNTYFPVDRAGPVLRTLSQFNPVYHLSETFRGLLLRGELDRHLGMLALTTAVWLLLSATAAHALIKRRVLGD
jgi:lipooligosaccharide transport system permease protein